LDAVLLGGGDAGSSEAVTSEESSEDSEIPESGVSVKFDDVAL